MLNVHFVSPTLLKPYIQYVYIFLTHFCGYSFALFV